MDGVVGCWVEVDKAVLSEDVAECGVLCCGLVECDSFERGLFVNCFECVGTVTVVEMVVDFQQIGSED